MARFKKLSLDEARETFTLLSEAEQRAIKGGCSKCEEARSYGYNVYTQGEFEQMLDAGTWTGGYVCGIGHVLPAVDYETDGFSGNYGSFCSIHNLYFPINGACYECGGDYGENYEGGSYGGIDYGPNPDGYGGMIGGGGTGGNNDGGELWTSKELMDSSKFVSWGGDGSNCLTLCKEIMDNYKVGYGDSAHVYQLLEKKEGNYVNRTIDPVSNYRKAIDCINRHLDAGRPIIVGIAYDINSNVNEGVTDHFVVITGRGFDTGKGQYYFTYMDPGYGESGRGCSVTENRLYFQTPNSTPSLIDNHAGAYDYKFRVSQVRPNDGKNLNETVDSNNL